MYIQALVVAALSASASAANCWPSVTNGIYTSDVGVQLAWNLRSTLCLNYWNSNTRIQTYHGADWGDCGTNWKGAGSSFCWGGYFVSSYSSIVKDLELTSSSKLSITQTNRLAGYVIS